MDSTPSPDPQEERRKEPRGGRGAPRGGARGAEREVTPKLTNSETAMGGADAIEKTSYVTGRGTSPEARSDGPIATVPSGGGISMGAIVVVVVLVAIALLYGGSLFR